MAEAEELVAEAARHATLYTRDLWRRYRPLPSRVLPLTLADAAPRLNYLLRATFNADLSVRPAQLPAHVSLLAVWFGHHRRPRATQSLPATDGASIWLPADLGELDAGLAGKLYRAMALQQAMRIVRGSAQTIGRLPPLQADVYLLLETHAADRALAAMLPGMATSIELLKGHALTQRPPLATFPRPRVPLERLAREFLASPCGAVMDEVPDCATAADSERESQRLIDALQLLPATVRERHLGPSPLLKDWWTGELLAPESSAATMQGTDGGEADATDPSQPRSSRLSRRPRVRDAEPEEDQAEQQGAWMVQGDEPHQHAEDPLGMQRPTDRDQQTNADHYGDLVSELPEARLVATPGRPKEVLLSDDPPAGAARLELAPGAAGVGLCYPEWDYRSGRYGERGARVCVRQADLGSQQWVDDTLARHKTLVNLIKRRFETLHARRVWQRRQLDGDEVDLTALIDGYADLRAGSGGEQAFYQSRRSARRDLAVTLLVDISGSTDSWVSANRRIIDVEREALLLVCVALESLGEPYSILAFSGQGPEAVSVLAIKGFDERYSNTVALRISALEPEHYTRAGAAIRHATAGLMQQPAAHRLLLLLSDGKPNDQDHYEGRYGVEDMRQAVTEAKAQGVYPFCLTVDRKAGDYLQRVFGAHQYALLPKPERLPMVLLEWMKRLAAG